MKTIFILIVVILSAGSLHSMDADSLLDKNTAFFEGDQVSYIISPPAHFIMDSEAATDDGYSFAFIPKNESYDSASIVIGVNMYRIKKDGEKEFSLPILIESDTAAYREHYGASLTINNVTPLLTETGEKLTTFFFNDSSRFIPNVMLAYLNGGSEIIVFELSITDLFPRFKAEELFSDCIKRIKILTKGTIGVG